jgi:septation ring formation regulator EzrA
MNIQEIETLLKEVESKVKQIEKLISHYGTAYPVAKDELDIMQRLERIESVLQSKGLL